MNGVIYARYSSDNQREESIEGQLRECIQYAQKNGITIISQYCDRALSARTDNRPEFQRMIADSDKQQFEIVLVWKLDRFSRDRYDSAHYKHRLKQNGVKVVSATENISSDPSGIMMEVLLEGMAEYYSAELSEKVNRGLKENAYKGKFNGGSIPVGFRVNCEQKLEADPGVAPYVLKAFNDYDCGCTMKEIVSRLSAAGIMTSRNTPMSLNSISRMLRNRRYIGDYTYKDIKNPNAIPAIVPDDLFERVQIKIAKSRKAPAKRKAEEDYLLTTKLFCGKCGSAMIGESGTSHTKQLHRYYRCVNTKKRKTCDKKAVKKDWIEGIVIEHTMQVIMDDDLLERISDAAFKLQGKENPLLPTLRANQKSIEKSIKNIVTAIENGISADTVRERLTELETQKRDIAESIAVESLKNTTFSKEQILFWLQRFRKLDITDIKQLQYLIDVFVNAIYLYDDRLVIVFNYKDGTQTASFNEIPAKAGSGLIAFAAPE